MEKIKINQGEGLTNCYIPFPLWDSTPIQPNTIPDISIDYLYNWESNVGIQYDITYNADKVIVSFALPDIKAADIKKLELVNKSVILELNNTSRFIKSTYCNLLLGCEIKSRKKAILEYGVLTIELEKVSKDKKIEIEEK